MLQLNVKSPSSGLPILAHRSHTSNANVLACHCWNGCRAGP